MRTVTIALILLTQIAALSCSTADKTVSRAAANPDFYLSQSQSTHPRELAWLYQDLPRDKNSICELIKKQFIHPLEVGPYRDLIPQERYFEDTVYHSVHAMLSGLLDYDSAGLTQKREPQNRLVVACLHHSLLFASILRHQGTPVRIRVGVCPVHRRNGRQRRQCIACRL